MIRTVRPQGAKLDLCELMTLWNVILQSHYFLLAHYEILLNILFFILVHIYPHNGN